MDLQGTLDIFPLAELIDMAGFSSLTGTIMISEGKRGGQIYFFNGKPYHAEYGSLEGFEALAAMFESTQAAFRVKNDMMTDRSTLWGDIDYHLRTAQRLAQRWSQVRPYISSLDLIPDLNGKREQLLPRVSPSHTAIFDLIDGEMSLAQIIVESGWGDIDAAEVVTQLVLDNIVRMTPARMPTTDAGRSVVAQKNRSPELSQRIANSHALTPEPAYATTAASRARSSSTDRVLQLLRN
jgi:hypothetical protein